MDLNFGDILVLDISPEKFPRGETRKVNSAPISEGPVLLRTYVYGVKKIIMKLCSLFDFDSNRCKV